MTSPVDHETWWNALTEPERDRIRELSGPAFAKMIGPRMVAIWVAGKSRVYSVNELMALHDGIELRAPFRDDPGRDGLIVAAYPLMRWLGKHHHPHVKAIVDSESVEMLEGILSSGLGKKNRDG